MTRKKRLMIVLGLIACVGAVLLGSYGMHSGKIGPGAASRNQSRYETCRNATTTDDHGNEYGEIVCAFAEIRTGDAFLVDMGHGKQVVFMYAGTASGAGDTDFDSEQENAWRYQVVGGDPVSKNLTFRIADGSDRVSGFSFRDMNYDGYPDLIDGVHQGAGAQSWRLIFWFNPDTNTFEAPDYGSSTHTMDALYSESDFNVKDRTIIEYGTSGNDSSYQYDYRFVDQTWVLVHSTYSSPDKSGARCVTEEGNLVNGKMIEKKTSTPRDEGEHC